MTEKQEQFAELDKIAAAAVELIPDSSGSVTEEGAAGPQPEEPAAPQLNDVMFDATVDVTIGTIKMGLEEMEGGAEAAALWDSPLFKKALKPVLVKYNITLENLPVELVLIGTVSWLAFQSAKTIAAAREKNASTKPAEA